MGKSVMPRAFLLVLAGLVLTLTPVALASPPDQTWISGLYDDDDYDDVILAITTAVGSVDCPPLPDTCCVRVVVAILPQIDESLQATPPLASNHPRAPPAS